MPYYLVSQQSSDIVVYLRVYYIHRYQNKYRHTYNVHMTLQDIGFRQYIELKEWGNNVNGVILFFCFVLIFMQMMRIQQAITDHIYKCHF